MDNLYTTLLFEAAWAFTHPVLPKVRAVSGYWLEDTLHLTVYHNGELSEEEAWDISEATGHTVANFGGTTLEEKFIRWDEPKPLPEGERWVYPPPKNWTEGLDEKQAKLLQSVQETMSKKSITGLRAISAEWSVVGLIFIRFYFNKNLVKLESIAENIAKTIMSPFKKEERANCIVQTSHPYHGNFIVKT